MSELCVMCYQWDVIRQQEGMNSWFLLHPGPFSVAITQYLRWVIYKEKFIAHSSEGQES
jgi:hypothetical protein